MFVRRLYGQIVSVRTCTSGSMQRQRQQIFLHEPNDSVCSGCQECTVSLTSNVLDITGRSLKPYHEKAKDLTAFHLFHKRGCWPAINLSSAI